MPPPSPTPPACVEVIAPSRLHFGLFSLGGGERQFGGVGVMVDEPHLQLRLIPAERFHAHGLAVNRVLAFAQHWAAFHKLPALPFCDCEILTAPPEHAGLGSGTQLGLSVAAALAAFTNLPQQSPVELAVSVGRGFRSAVGTYGFAGGGLIVERGKSQDEAISPLDCRLDLPNEWRFVLITPVDQHGISGSEEQQVFSSLPQVSAEVSHRLIAEVRERLVPATARGDFDQFSDSLYRYGHDAGLCFAAKQGGPYNGPVLTSLVERIRSLGVRGVGQSSWGPTIFAVTRNAHDAQQLAHDIQSHWTGATAPNIVISRPNNTGATVRVMRDTACR